jgi:hypothetical protein
MGEGECVKEVELTITPIFLARRSVIPGIVSAVMVPAPTPLVVVLVAFSPVAILPLILALIALPFITPSFILPGECQT